MLPGDHVWSANCTAKDGALEHVLEHGIYIQSNIAKLFLHCKPSTQNFGLVFFF